MSDHADRVRAALCALLPADLGWTQPPTPADGQGAFQRGAGTWVYDTPELSVSVGLASNGTLVLTLHPFAYRDEHEQPVAYQRPVAVNAAIDSDVALLGVALAAAGLPVRTSTL